MIFVTQPNNQSMINHIDGLKTGLKEDTVVSLGGGRIDGIGEGERLVIFGHGNPETIGWGNEEIGGCSLAGKLYDLGLPGHQERDFLLISCRTGKQETTGLAHEFRKELGVRGISGDVIAPRGWVIGSRHYIGGLPQVLNSSPLANALASGDQAGAVAALNDVSQSFPMPPGDAWRKFPASTDISASFGVADLLGLYT